MNQVIAHKIKHRKFANDEFMTPEKLASKLMATLPIKIEEIIVDPCPGKGAFTKVCLPYSQVVGLTGDFFLFQGKVDWLVSNPPYSKLDDWLSHSFELADVGVAYLLGLHNITPRRLELANNYGFGLTLIHLCKVFHWFGISAFVVWQRGKSDVITYDRIVWR